MAVLELGKAPTQFHGLRLHHKLEFTNERAAGSRCLSLPFHPIAMNPHLATLCLAMLSTVALAADPKSATVTNDGKATTMKKGAATPNVATLPVLPPSKSLTERDGSGRIARQSSASSTGTVTTRDASGRIIATSSTTKSGSTSTTTHRDASGRILGNTYKSPTGTETTRDGSGRITTTASTTTSGDSSTTTYRDGSGRIIGTKYVSPSGSVTYRNASGSITGPDLK